MSTFITHTPLSTIRPTGSESERAFGRITALIERNLSEAHAAAFADPVLVQNGSGIDWYTDIDADILPLRELDQADADTVRRILQGILDDLRALADKLDAPDTGKQNKTAIALRNATVVPGEDYIYAIRTGNGWRPIVVAWGFESHDMAALHAFNVSTFAPSKDARAAGSQADANGIARSLPGKSGAGGVPTPAPMPEPAPSTQATRVGGLGWLLPLVSALVALAFVVAIVALLLPACGLRTPFGTISFGFPGGYGCSVGLAAIPELEKGQALERELAVLQQDYQRQRLTCLLTQQSPPPAPAVPAAQPVPAQTEQRFEERVDERGEAQVTLIWEGTDDLDLWLECPDRTVVNYRNKNACGGTLDIDQNASLLSPQPVENITFPNGLTASGQHRIGVQLYTSRSKQFPLPFQVRIRDASGSRVLNGQFTREKEMVLVDQLNK